MQKVFPFATWVYEKCSKMTRTDYNDDNIKEAPLCRNQAVTAISNVSFYQFHLQDLVILFHASLFHFQATKSFISKVHVEN